MKSHGTGSNTKNTRNDKDIPEIRHLESESRTKNKSPEAQNDIKMHFFDFYEILLCFFNKFQIYFINYSGF
jgi:hypothetical protein